MPHKCHRIRRKNHDFHIHVLHYLSASQATVTQPNLGYSRLLNSDRPLCPGVFGAF